MPVSFCSWREILCKNKYVFTCILNVSQFLFKCYHCTHFVPLLFYLTYLGDDSCVTQKYTFTVFGWIMSQDRIFRFLLFFFLIYNFFYPLFFKWTFFFFSFFPEEIHNVQKSPNSSFGLTLSPLGVFLPYLSEPYVSCKLIMRYLGLVSSRFSFLGKNIS